MAFTVIKNETGISVVEVRSHLVSIGIFGEKVAGKTKSTETIEFGENTYCVLRPSLKRLIATEIKDATCNGVIANGQIRFVAKEGPPRFTVMGFAGRCYRALQNIEAIIVSDEIFCSQIIRQRSITTTII